MFIMINRAHAKQSFKSLTSAQSQKTNDVDSSLPNHIPLCFALLTCMRVAFQRTKWSLVPGMVNILGGLRLLFKTLVNLFFMPGLAVNNQALICVCARGNTTKRFGSA